MPIIVGFGPTMEFQTVLSCLLGCFNIFIFLAQYYDVRRVYRTIDIMTCNKLMFSALTLNHVHLQKGHFYSYGNRKYVLLTIGLN